MYIISGMEQKTGVKAFRSYSNFVYISLEGYEAIALLPGCLKMEERHICALRLGRRKSWIRRWRCLMKDVRDKKLKQPLNQFTKVAILSITEKGGAFHGKISESRE